METLIERFVSSTARCYGCGGLVYAVEQKKTANHIYHNRCFRCRICKRNLTGSTLNEEGDDIYCANCYRKKQRGDCNSLAFRRAADERAQYVHNNRHPDQPPPSPNLQPPIRRDFSRYPSQTLHQLERRFLSHQEPNIRDLKKPNNDHQRLTSSSHPLTIHTSFSAPGHLRHARSHSSLTNDELPPSPSPSFNFLPVLSPFSTYSGASTPNTAGLHNGTQFNNSNDGIRSRSNRNSFDFTNLNTPPNQQRHSIFVDTSHKYENKEIYETKFRFPDKVTTPIRHRSSSSNYGLNSRKIK